MKIELVSGRTIRLSQIQQWRTNAGLLAGKPGSEQNDDKVRSVLETAREYGRGLGEPLLIEPRRTPVPADPARRLPAAEWLPATTCIAVFDSNELARPDSDAYSSLVVAWFQDEFALPIDEAVVAKIREVDWEERATDWMW